MVLLEVFDEVAVKLAARVAISERLENLLPCSLTWFVAALLPSGLLNCGSQFFATWASPQGCQSILKTWQVTFPRASNPREREQEKKAVVPFII